MIKISAAFPKNPAGFTISDQLVRAGTSIGANLIEAQEAVSPKDFRYKIAISLKEAKEAKYWLELIRLSGLLDKRKIRPLLQEVDEIGKILVVTLKKLREKER